jgi:hypothetical protein
VKEWTGFNSFVKDLMADSRTYGFEFLGFLRKGKFSSTSLNSNSSVTTLFYGIKESRNISISAFVREYWVHNKYEPLTSICITCLTSVVLKQR